MKKILLSILILLLCILTYIAIFRTLKIGSFKVDSISDIKVESMKLDTGLKQATQLTAQRYPAIKNELNTAINKLTIKKQQYETKISSMANSDVLQYMQIDTYEKEFLWATIGTYATKENIDLEMNIVDVQNNNYYNLEFTIVGKYSDISDFLYSIENDDDLGFRIQDFLVQPYAISESTQITSSNGAIISSKKDPAYDYTQKNDYSGTQATKKTEEKKNTQLNTTGSNTVNDTNETKTSSSPTSTVMYSPDRGYATFTVKNVNINMN